MELTSSAFKNGQPIPKRYSNEGENVSPGLSWKNAPNGCREWVIRCEDPDAPKRPNMDHPFIHWVAYHISPHATELPEGLLPHTQMQIPVRLSQGMNSADEVGYMGPLPPIGHGTHRYFFKIFALDTELPLPSGATWFKVEEAMKGHIIEASEIMGTYVRDSE